MKSKLQTLGLALVFLMPATLTYAQSQNSGESAAVPSLSASASRGDAGNDAPSQFTGNCIYSQAVNNGEWILLCDDPRITASSSVFASISQYNPVTGRRVLGNAQFVVENIVPINGEVKVLVDVISGSSVYPWMTILVINP